MGVLGGIGSHPSHLDHVAATADRLFGDHYHLSAFAAGRHQMEIVAQVAALGGHIPVGLEDNLYIGRRRLAADNAELVAAAVTVAREQGHGIAGPDEVHRLLALRAQHGDPVNPVDRDTGTAEWSTVHERTGMQSRVDVHAHIAVDVPDFAERYGDPRWPSLRGGGAGTRLYRGGRVVRELPAAATSIGRRMTELDVAGIGQQLLSPVPPLLCDWADEHPATEWARHLNRGVAAAVDEGEGRLRGLGSVPIRHPDSAIVVLREAKAFGLKGVEIGTTAGSRELDDPDLLEFFQAAGELDMLVFVHPLVLGARAGWTGRIDTLELTFGLGMTTDTAIAAARLVLTGTMKACPKLRLLLAHGGGSFIWALTRIARLWDSSHDVTVEDLARGVHVDSVVFDERNLRYLVDRLGAERVLFGTDYPLPGADSLQADTLNQLTTAERRLVEGGNARALLGLT